MPAVSISGAASISGGMLTGVRYWPSPNFDERPDGEKIHLIVVHAISLPPGEFGGDGVEGLFTNQLDPATHPFYRDIYNLRVSAHFFVRRDGSITQYVSCDKRAWHAGISCWGGREQCNDFSIGIELEGCDEKAFEFIQYQSLAYLVRVLAQYYPIEEIVGHADISPLRKTDPGPCFEWALLKSEIFANLLA